MSNALSLLQLHPVRLARPQRSVYTSQTQELARDRWKQSDIHVKREEAKQKVKNLHAELEMNAVLLPRMDAFISSTESEGMPFVERKAAELRQSSDQSKPAGSTGPSYHEMELSLLVQLGEMVKDKLKDADDTERVKKSVAWLEDHRAQMAQRSVEAKKEIADIEAEQKKHITSDDIHVGFDSGVSLTVILLFWCYKADHPWQHVSANANTAQPDETRKSQVKAVDTKIETINDPVAAATSGPSTSGYQSDVDTNDLARRASASDEEDIPDLSSAARQFIAVPIDKWEKLFACISDHPELLHPKTVDAILMEAFNVAGKGDATKTMACVHQALILQYCAKLGRDGVSLFFKRMSANNAGRELFRNDVKSTYDRIWTRSKEIKAEEGDQGGEEAIQLVATEEGTKISFNVPTGPPPENITLEGEGTENFDVEEVKSFLNRQWDIFDAFPKHFKEALQDNSLDRVNTCLARMALDEAEETVKRLQEAGILSFSSSEIVDETGKQG